MLTVEEIEGAFEQLAPEEFERAVTRIHAIRQERWNAPLGESPDLDFEALLRRGPIANKASRRPTRAGSRSISAARTRAVVRNELRRRVEPPALASLRED